MSSQHVNGSTPAPSEADAIEALARQEAARGDARALRTVLRLRDAVNGRKRLAPDHQDDGA